HLAALVQTRERWGYQLCRQCSISRQSHDAAWSNATSKDGGEAMSAKARILVVDDDATMREALRDTLSTEGYGVIAVENAIQAIAELEKQEADLVLADLTLPRVSGLELLDSVRRHWPGLEVIVITGQGSIETAVDAIKRGAYHYVTKPFTPDDILHLVG